MPKKQPGDWSTGPGSSPELRNLHYVDAQGVGRSVANLTEKQIDQKLAEVKLDMLTAANAGKAFVVNKQPMTRDEYQEYITATMDRLKEIMRQKNADYTGGDTGPFANFMVSEQLGLADARIGLLIRMVDKIQRIKSFVAKGKLEVKNEGAEDAALDIVGYGLLLLGMLEDAKRQNQ